MATPYVKREEDYRLEATRLSLHLAVLRCCFLGLNVSDSSDSVERMYMYISVDIVGIPNRLIYISICFFLLRYSHKGLNWTPQEGY